MSGSIHRDYPWTHVPLVVSAPMRLIALSELAVEVTKAGGLGFIGSGSDQSNLEDELSKASSMCRDAGLRGSSLPIGVGFLNWGADLAHSVSLIGKFRPCAVWFFAPRSVENLIEWTEKCREATEGQTKIWIQVGAVEEAIRVAKACRPDVLVVQGGCAGGHGLNQATSIVCLVPEVQDALHALKSNGDITELPAIVAAGGISDGRGAAAALALGADGICMGTRFLAAPEAAIATGYRDEVLRATDGGQSTARSSIYDTLRGTTDWPKQYGGRGVINKSYVDAGLGMSWDENIRLYAEAVKQGDAGWGPEGRMATYAGAGVGLVRKEQKAGEIVSEVRREYSEVVRKLKG